MTWHASPRETRQPRRLAADRDSVLHEVLTTADARRDGTLPWADVDGVSTAFDSRDDLLGAMQMRWHTRLSGAVERQLSEQAWDLPQAVVHAWRGLSAEMPGVRAVLDAYADHEAMARARRKEWVLLATASGLAAMDDPAAPRLGRDLERRARSVTGSARGAEPSG